MADEVLLASVRAYPSKLITNGFRFTDATVDTALAAALA
jgi:NAD dependent epimerase/dehydratase family enzyme